jgi:hypothetical protein
MSTLKSSDDHLTLNADGSGKAIKFQADGVEKASINSSGLLTSTTIDATALTGNLPAIDGSNLTGISAGTALTGSTNNTIPTVTGANAISGEANLTFDGTDLTLGTGDIVFGTSGKGICLGVTSNTDSNTLDDYEEGTWTPSLPIAPSGVTLGTIYTAKYTKIGNRVLISLACKILSSSDPAPDADMRMSGFPFSFHDGNMAFPVIMHYNYRQTPMLFMNGGGYFYYQGTTVGGNNLKAIGHALDDDNQFSLAMQYQTTA